MVDFLHYNQSFNQISTAFEQRMQNKKEKDKENPNGQGDDNNPEDDKKLLGGKKQNDRENE